jgi:riboflavin kinase/FMN adenylyltransferase
MEVIRGLINIKERHKGSVITIGNFDGVHTGHQSILSEVKARSKTLGVGSMLMCFEPQPREFFDINDAPARLTRFREKVDILEDLGIDYVLCLKFNKKTREISAAGFVDLLVEDLAIGAIYVGDDFRFGHDRSGSFQDLEAAGEEHGFEVYNFYTIFHEDSRISSTRIRECLRGGDFEAAEDLLGHPYSITGKVIYGRQIGRTLGFPTANIQLQRYVAPISGVFACEALVNGKVYPSVANIGLRPTVDDETPEPILEVHLFDFDEDIYGHNVKVVFRHKIRDERKFNGLDELKAAIQADSDRARRFFEEAR